MAAGLAVRAGLALVLAAASGAEPARTFGVLDLSDPPAAPAVRARVEHEATSRGLAAITDAITQRALGAADSPVLTAYRLSGEARRARDQGDCATGLARAREAEEAVLIGMPIDEARQPARAA